MRPVRAVALSMPLLVGPSVGCSGARQAPAPAPALSASGVAAGRVAAPRADDSLLSRKVLFGSPDRAQVKMSPDGHRIGWLAPVEGVVTVFIAAADEVQKAQPIPPDGVGDVGSWWWSFDSTRVVFARDMGEGAPHLYAVDLAKNETKDVTAGEGVHAELLALSPRRPHEALVALNARDKAVSDVYSIDLTTGAKRLVQQNDGGYSDWLVDDDLRVRYVTRHNADGSADLVQPGHAKDKTPPLQHVPFEDALSVEAVGFDKTGNTLYLSDSRGHDTEALVALDTKTGAATVVAKDPGGDADQVLFHPTAKAVEAVSFDDDSSVWRVIDASVELDFEYLGTFGDGRLFVTSRSLDELRWLVGYGHSDGPTQYYRYDRDPDKPGDAGKAALLFSGKDDLVSAKLSTMRPVGMKARDGLDLAGYLTLPYAQDPRAEERPSEPLPTVVLVHDGPWARSRLEYSAEHQWLASRGYAVLSVNYRGSTGYGAKFIDAGNLEWGGKMHEDVLDAIAWAIDQRIADPAKVAIMGAGYGGYEVLVSLSTSPNTFACGVDVGGPSNLVTFGQTAPFDSRPPLEELARRMGDWRTDDGKKLLADRSPLTHVRAANKPLLIAQGKDDPRVREAETAEFVTALKSTGVPVTYVVYPGKGPGLARPPDRALRAVAEVFLAQCLGGSYQPFGDDLAGSAITVPVGAESVRGLRSALNAKK
jgi:dipeptidyl aminopeptidase/acylaminoacyl peptidase